MTQTMNILLAGTGDYAVRIFETLFSVKQFTDRHIDAYVMIDCKRVDFFQRMFDMNRIDDVDVHVYDSSKLDEVFNPQLKTGVVTKMTYARIVLMDMLADQIDKVLQLDPDVWQVKPGLEELYDMDITDFYAAGVEDISVKYFNKTELDMCKTDLYINAGVMLVNLKKAKEDCVLKSMMDCLKEPLSFLIDKNIKTQCDQAIINCYMGGNIKAVNPKFNIQRHLMCFPQNNEFAKQWGYRDEDDMLKNCVLAHAGGMKPWQKEYGVWQPFQHRKCIWQKHYWEYITSMVHMAYPSIEEYASIAIAMSKEV